MTATTPKLFYLMQGYQSHLRVATQYRQMLRDRYPFSRTIDEADVVILHWEPHSYERLYKQHPVLFSKYVIAYCVWEADPLPNTYRKSLEFVQEVWTCSKYCCDLFAPYHSRVVYMPHPISRVFAASRNDEAFVRTELDYDPECFYFVSVIRTLGTRKNVKGLVKAFHMASRFMPKARLILKGIPGDPLPHFGNRNVLYVPLYFSESQIDALYGLCHCYVSAHHSEGWGLPLSDAMLCQMPVIATGYSGNLDFMNGLNSFPIEFREQVIKPEDVFGPFTESMKWAYPSVEDLAARMRYIYEERSSSAVKTKVLQARLDAGRFSYENIQNLIHNQMDRVVRECV